MHDQPWMDLLNEDDRRRLEAARFARRVGMGERPAVVVIDVQNYMVGAPDPGSEVAYPSACPTGRAAVTNLSRLLPAARAAGVPVFYTRFELRRDGRDIGVYGRKRDLLDTEGWCLEDSVGAEIVPEVAAQPEDIVFVKKKPSAFHGTPLLGLLVDRGIDTLVVTGGSTSNCVRATVVDAMSYNYRPIVVEDCVFDRFEISHRVTLFDMDRQYADVMGSEDVMGAFSRLGDRPAES